MGQVYMRRLFSCLLVLSLSSVAAVSCATYETSKQSTEQLPGVARLQKHSSQRLVDLKTSKFHPPMWISVKNIIFSRSASRLLAVLVRSHSRNITNPHNQSHRRTVHFVPLKFLSPTITPSTPLLSTWLPVLHLELISWSPTRTPTPSAVKSHRAAETFFGTALPSVSSFLLASESPFNPGSPTAGTERSINRLRNNDEIASPPISATRIHSLPSNTLLPRTPFSYGSEGDTSLSTSPAFSIVSTLTLPSSFLSPSVSSSFTLSSATKPRAPFTLSSEGSLSNAPSRVFVGPRLSQNENQKTSFGVKVISLYAPDELDIHFHSGFRSDPPIPSRWAFPVLDILQRGLHGLALSSTLSTINQNIFGGFFWKSQVTSSTDEKGVTLSEGSESSSNSISNLGETRDYRASAYPSSLHFASPSLIVTQLATHGALSIPPGDARPANPFQEVMSLGASPSLVQTIPPGVSGQSTLSPSSSLSTSLAPSSVSPSISATLSQNISPSSQPTGVTNSPSALAQGTFDLSLSLRPTVSSPAVSAPLSSQTVAPSTVTDGGTIIIPSSFSPSGEASGTGAPLSPPNDVINEPDRNQTGVVQDSDGSTNSTLADGDGDPPSIVSGQWRDKLNTGPSSRAFPIVMGIVGAILVLVLLVLVIPSFSSDPSLSYTYDSQRTGGQGSRPSEFGSTQGAQQTEEGMSGDGYGLGSSSVPQGVDPLSFEGQQNVGYGQGTGAYDSRNTGSRPREL